MASGKRTAIPPERRLICDIVGIAQQMPLVPLAMTIDVAELARCRRRASPQISWAVVMMRAMALVSREFPALRTVYVPLPWPHFYEHPESIAMLAINREIEGQPWLLCARFHQPENHSLVQLQQIYDRYRESPPMSVRQIRHQVRFAKLPWLLRKAGWMIMTRCSAAGKVRMMGTFGMSPSRTRSIHGTWHLGPLTTTLGFDPYCVDGQCHVTLTFDHRILDGLPAAEVLHRLGNVLRNQMCNELRALDPATEEQGPMQPVPAQRRAA
jgi:hypothetical protein